ncbi:protein PIN-LIKES 7-like isoform X1 [Typha latifolia]|uniref:protein PIN-LIKES 7-like isoform X1 n=1 Tax=Typha latifolia TaxID=4733 RepID=UPI003C30C956
MDFFSLFAVASAPVLQILLLGLLGAFLASKYCNILSAEARKYINKIVFVVFAPALVFASLAETVTLQDIISWWFMPVNIAITFFIGGILGWIAVKILKPEHYLEGIIIASCSAGNLGNLPLIVIPAICNEDGSPFGEPKVCNSHGLSYVSFSMALGGIFIWTHAYRLVRKSALLYGEIHNGNEHSEESAKAHREREEGCNYQEDLLLSSTKPVEDLEHQIVVPFLSKRILRSNASHFWGRLKGLLKDGVHRIAEELITPPTIAAVLGFVFGATPWLKSLLIGDAAPLRVIKSTITILGGGTIPCVTLILGGNLTRGFHKSVIKPSVISAIIAVRYAILPLFGIAVVKLASQLGFLPPSPLYHFVLLIQFTLPPAMSIGTMAQLFDVGQEECSVIFLWTYLIAAIALAFWSTIFMSILV